MTSGATRRRLHPRHALPFRRPPPPDPHANPHVAVIERAHADLGLGYADIARAVGANVSTRHDVPGLGGERPRVVLAAAPPESGRPEPEGLGSGPSGRPAGGRA